MWAFGHTLTAGTRFTTARHVSQGLAIDSIQRFYVASGAIFTGRWRPHFSRFR